MNTPSDDASSSKKEKDSAGSLFSSSWSIVGKAISQIGDGSVQLVSQSASALGSMGQGVLATTGLTRWLSLSATTTEGQQFDDKHFFLVPYAPAKEGFSFATIRALPPDVAPVNDLPKRRFIHLPNAASRAMLTSLIAEHAKATSRKEASTAGTSSVNQSLTGIADQLDQIDSQLFYGALALGTVVALINPLAGAVVAAKALAPSAIATLAKYGLRRAGSSFEASAIESKVRIAEAEVLKQFSHATTREIVNPMLAKLSLAIRTDELEFDPLFEELPMMAEEKELPITKDECQQLTAQAILNVYAETLSNSFLQEKARLGPEDLRWLRSLQKPQI